MIPHSKPFWGEEEIEQLTACARSLRLKGGPCVAELEQEVSGDLGYAGAVATPTGRTAIQLALRAHLAPGDLVGCPSYICRSVYDAIVMAGCEPGLLDIDPVTFSTSLDDALRSGLRAVIVAHMFGIRAPIEKFLRSGLFVIEDCAQRLADPGASRNEPRAPVRILSFEATKILTSGEGGMMLADDPELLDQVRRLRDAPYDFPHPAPGFAPTDLQAAVALTQWRRLPAFLRRRREIANFYLQQLEGAPAMSAPDTYHFRFVLRTPDPDAFIHRAADHGVTVRRPVAPMCLHKLFGISGDFRVCDAAMSEVVSLPIYPALTDAEAQQVVAAAQAAQKSPRTLPDGRRSVHYFGGKEPRA